MNNYLVTVNGEERKISIHPDGRVFMEEEQYELDIIEMNKHAYLFKFRDKILEITLFKKPDGDYSFTLDGYSFDVTAETFLKKITSELFNFKSNESNNKRIKSPMPGLIVNIFVKPGDIIKKGDPLYSLEAMKMENIIKAAGDCEINTVSKSVGEAVDKNEEILNIK